MERLDEGCFCFGDVNCIRFLRINNTSVFLQELFSSVGSSRCGELQIVEIGSGPGCNFSYFPPCVVTCVDPNPEWPRFLEKNLKRAPHIRARLMIQGAEDMSEIKDCSIEVVVTTAALCSVQNPEKVLSEIIRILKPVSWFIDWC